MGESKGERGQRDRGGEINKGGEGHRELTDRQKYIQADKQVDRQTDRQTPTLPPIRNNILSSLVYNGDIAQFLTDLFHICDRFMGAWSGRHLGKGAEVLYAIVLTCILQYIQGTL